MKWTKWKMLVGRAEAKDVSRSEQKIVAEKLRSGLGSYYVYGVSEDPQGRGYDVFSYMLVDGIVRLASSSAIPDGKGGYLPRGATMMSEDGFPDDVCGVELAASAVLDDNLGFLYLYEFDDFDGFMGAMEDLDSRRAPYSKGSFFSFWEEHAETVRKIIRGSLSGPALKN